MQTENKGENKLVELFDNLVIEVDSRQYIVKRKSGENEEGKPIYTEYSYFQTLGAALDCVVNRTTKKILKERDADIKEAVKIYKEAVQMLASLKEELKAV